MIHNIHISTGKNIEDLKDALNNISSRDENIDKSLNIDDFNSSELSAHSISIDNKGISTFLVDDEDLKSITEFNNYSKETT